MAHFIADIVKVIGVEGGDIINTSRERYVRNKIKRTARSVSEDSTELLIKIIENNADFEVIAVRVSEKHDDTKTLQQQCTSLHSYVVYL